MGICILSISTIYSKVSSSSNAKEKSLNRVFHTGGICRSKGMEHRGCALGTITALSGSASTTPFYMVLPMGAQNYSTLGSIDRGTIHAESFKLIQLLSLTKFPFRPSARSLELSSGEVS